MRRSQRNQAQEGKQLRAKGRREWRSLRGRLQAWRDFTRTEVTQRAGRERGRKRREREVLAATFRALTESRNVRLNP